MYIDDFDNIYRANDKNDIDCAWGIYNDELYNYGEKYAVEIIDLQADCLNSFQTIECDGKCNSCSLQKRINALHTGICNIILRSKDYDIGCWDFKDFLEGYITNYGWRIIKYGKAPSPKE